MKKKPKGSSPASSEASAPRPRGRRLLQYGLLLLGGLLFLDAIVGEKGLIEIVKARQQYEVLERSLFQLRNQNASLRAQVKALSQDHTIEELARRDLGLIKPGEHLFIIKDLDSPSH